ncbi:acyl-CoA dehydrogenase C-terminal domain-containing protein [Undibacterium sp. TJN25]|uniref:acyl-CoA dehydrogenase C-terminal domain-containing protein n=1 Tax=Undibacterium sp. TJN25 TaxID=3413056 RepID=UPI003BF2D366
MPTYEAPLRDVRFLLEKVFHYETVIGTLDGYEEVGLDVVLAVLDSAATFVQGTVLPINLPGDNIGCLFEEGAVTTPPGYKRAYRLYREAGWSALAADPEYGGQGLPASLGLIVREFVASGSMSFGMYAGLSQGAYRALLAHGSEELKQTYLPRLAAGEWAGTMCMTEAEGGSDLSQLRTRAIPVADGSYQVSGTKIFISGGDHDLTENIVHLVLARLPDAPEGTRGLSLFVVPKYLPGTGAGNGVACGSVEHKMGIRASATAVLHFEEAQGWLLGKENGGMQAMFTMMNSSRIGVAVQSLGAAEISFQNALSYAKERCQGRTPDAAKSEPGPSHIIGHPDVRIALLKMKALVEGSRALYIESALALDIKARHPDQAERELAEGRLALLTPVLKSFISDCALEVTYLGIQVFGGHGYVHENGMEHLYRDARIVPLYEGTNAIQALDLVHRKIGLDDGRVLQAYLNGLETLVSEGRHHAALDTMAGALAAALALLRHASTRLRTLGAGGVQVEVGAAASDYLRLFGLVAMGGAWLRMARAAHDTLQAGSDATDFLQGKIKTADFYFQRVLPETEQLHRRITTGATSIMAIKTEEF